MNWRRYIRLPSWKDTTTILFEQNKLLDTRLRILEMDFKRYKNYTDWDTLELRYKISSLENKNLTKISTLKQDQNKK